MSTTLHYNRQSHMIEVVVEVVVKVVKYTDNIFGNLIIKVLDVKPLIKACH